MMRTSPLKVIGTFLFVWLMVGFALGTIVLLGPVRWITAALRDAGWSERVEDGAMWAVILAFVALSILAARGLTRWLMDTRRRTVKVAVPIAVTALALVALWGWMHPALYAGLAGGESGLVTTRSGAVFVFGPYPDESHLRSLKEDGFDAVVSLQHPAVIPFEPAGIHAEKEAAARIDLPFIHAPMLPWVAENSESLDRILRLARTTTGKYYVHCGLGRDRTNVVKRMLEREGALVDRAGEALAATTFGDREQPLERGWHVELERDVWLIPYPNEHEAYGNLLAGQVAHVALLLDPADTTQAGWIRETDRLMKQYRIPVSHHPLPRDLLDRTAAVVRRVRALPRPLAIVVPSTRPREPSEVADSIEAAFRRLPGRVPPPPDRPATRARLNAAPG